MIQLEYVEVDWGKFYNFMVNDSYVGFVDLGRSEIRFNDINDEYFKNYDKSHHNLTQLILEIH